VLTTLLDSNVLIALGDVDHVHFKAAEQWFTGRHEQPFATCPITQGSLIRHLIRQRIVPGSLDASRILGGFRDHPMHRFWPDDIDYCNVRWDGVLGHRQVTDAYLAALARHHGGKVATLDSGFAALHDDVVELIPY
jgi:toxin-antitoxin system PIN domain toxin